MQLHKGSSGKKVFSHSGAPSLGSYLAEFLLDKGYEVHGLVRRHSITNTARIDHIIQSDYYKIKFFLHFADTTDSSNLMRLMAEIRPTEVYNLAAQSHVGISFDT